MHVTCSSKKGCQYCKQGCLNELDVVAAHIVANGSNATLWCSHMLLMVLYGAHVVTNLHYTVSSGIFHLMLSRNHCVMHNTCCSSRKLGASKD